jgi:hypothetical protein
MAFYTMLDISVSILTSKKMKVNINITNLDEFKEQSKAVEFAAEKLQEELNKLNTINLKLDVQKTEIKGRELLLKQKRDVI